VGVVGGGPEEKNWGPKPNTKGKRKKHLLWGGGGGFFFWPKNNRKGGFLGGGVLLPGVFLFGFFFCVSFPNKRVTRGGPRGVFPGPRGSSHPTHP